jgi:hypothetical protein
MLQGNSEELLISRCDLTYRRMRDLHATIVMKKHFLKYAAQIENIDNEDGLRPLVSFHQEAHEGHKEGITGLSPQDAKNAK